MANSVSPAILAVNSIAESIGMGHLDANTSAYLAGEAEKYVESFIRAMFHVKSANKSGAITQYDVNTLLEAKGQQHLLGYQNTPPSYSTTGINTPNEVIYPLQAPVELSTLLVTRITRPRNTETSTFRHVMLNGVSPLQKLNPRKTPTRVKSGEKYVPAAASGGGAYVEYADALTENQQQFLVRSINLIRDDSTNSAEFVLDALSKTPGIDQLLPYFLQFILGHAVLHMHNFATVSLLIRLESALLHNSSLNVANFAQAFLKLPISVLLADDLGTENKHDDMELRKRAAELVKVSIARFGFAYQGVKISLFNTFSGKLFNYSCSTESHYGSLLGILSLGGSFFDNLVPHLNMYLKVLNTCYVHRNIPNYVILDSILDILISKLSKSALAAAHNVVASAKRLKRCQK